MRENFVPWSPQTVLMTESLFSFLFFSSSLSLAHPNPNHKHKHALSHLDHLSSLQSHSSHSIPHIISFHTFLSFVPHTKLSLSRPRPLPLARPFLLDVSASLLLITLGPRKGRTPSSQRLPVFPSSRICSIRRSGARLLFWDPPRRRTSPGSGC